ncbi:helix-turn-helix domain-containing protein, partial [Desulfovibrio sp.]
IKTSVTAPREPLPDIRTTFNLEQAERLLVQRALDACQGNKSRAAELLGITREGLRKKLLRLDKTAHGHDGEEA